MNFTGDCPLYYGYETVSTWITVVTTITFIMSVVLNTSVIIFASKTTSPGPMKSYLINLVVSDLVFTATLPLRIDYYYNFFNWRWGEIACRITSFLFYINTYVSINFVTCISVNRYYAVNKPLAYNSRNHVLRTRIVCCVIWAVTLIEMIPILFVDTTSSDHESKIRCMEYNKISSSMNLLPWVTILMCVISFVVPLTTMLVSYSAVCYAMISGIAKSKRAIKSYKIVAVILTGFVICFLPYHLSVIVYMGRIINSSSKIISCEDVSYYQLILHVNQCLMNMNCCIDPIIYFFVSNFRNKNVKDSLKLMFK
ncbi:SWPV1-251 [Shearwaterpox virus]|uniref:SWPV1-251 n=1 Tax=Shearwaterpox virus TaxID=1974596 RepID=A0A1V0QH06_CNPV|nr:SWPV1-251 [Shearwaterpox virus]